MVQQLLNRWSLPKDNSNRSWAMQHTYSTILHRRVDNACSHMQIRLSLAELGIYTLSDQLGSERGSQRSITSAAQYILVIATCSSRLHTLELQLTSAPYPQLLWDPSKMYS